MKRTPVAVAAAALALATPVMASASAHVLFSQSAGSATTSAAHGASATVSMHTGHKAVVAFEERPGTRTGLMSEAAFSGLWGGSFRNDPPNAILTGVDAQGRNHRVVVRVTGVARTADGVRYRMRALRGSLPARLSPANLMIDSVPISAITAAMKAYLAGNSAKVNTYEPIINALMFPMAATVFASPTINIQRDTPMVVGSGGTQPQVINAQQIVFQPGAQMVFPPSTTVVNFVLEQPTAPCTMDNGLEVSVQVSGSTGGTTNYPGTSYSGLDTLAAPQPNGACLLNYDITRTPRPQGTTTFQTGMTFTNTSSQPVAMGPVNISAD